MNASIHETTDASATYGLARNAADAASTVAAPVSVCTSMSRVYTSMLSPSVRYIEFESAIHSFRYEPPGMKSLTSASICINAHPANPPAATAAKATRTPAFTFLSVSAPPRMSPIQRPIFVRPSARGAQHAQHASLGTVRQHATSRRLAARRHSSIVSQATNQVTWKKKVNRMPNAA